jgi:hypothetical protein
MRPIVWVVLVGTIAHAAPSPAPVVSADVSGVRDKLTVWSDGHKHFLALVLTSNSNSPVFWSNDGVTFYRLRMTSGASDGYDEDLKRLDRNFWEPRGSGASSEAGFRYSKESQKLVIECASREAPLERLEGSAATRLMAGASFREPRWQRYSYALARDDTGRYFYVDNVREPEGAKRFRLFSGPRGAMKLLKMTNVVSDSEGDIFSTPKGDLRLVLSKRESSWIVRNKPTKLIWLSVFNDENHALIYNDLGVYGGEPLGTPCDDL